MADNWLEKLSPADKQKAKRLLAFLDRAGAHDPETWVRSEIEEEIPQTARFLFLRRVWPELIDSWHDQTAYIPKPAKEIPPVVDEPFGEAAAVMQRLVNTGADPKDIGAFARHVAYETVFGLLYRLSQECDPEFEGQGEVPGWTLMETDTDGNSTGRPITLLHESLLAMDPSGREGRPR